MAAAQYMDALCWNERPPDVCSLLHTSDLILTELGNLQIRPVAVNDVLCGKMSAGACTDSVLFWFWAHGAPVCLVQLFTVCPAAYTLN